MVWCLLTLLLDPNIPDVLDTEKLFLLMLFLLMFLVEVEIAKFSLLTFLFGANIPDVFDCCQ